MNIQVSSWLGPLARVGYTAKGIVYLVVGWLALKAAFGPSKSSGGEGALKEIQGSDGGSIALIIVGIGLAAYSAYRLMGAFADTEAEDDDGGGLAKRMGYFGSGAAYGSLAAAALTNTLSRGGGQEKWAQKLLSIPAGSWILGVIGLSIVVAGVFQWIKVIQGSFKKRFLLDDFAQMKRRWVEGVAYVGLCSRGVVLLIIGGFLLKAAASGDASDIKGTGEALGLLADKGLGPWVLAVTAAGFICYGLYCWVLARYGNMGKENF